MNTIANTARHAAAGQYLGYALQPVRLFYYLLTSPQGARVSSELLDDIAVHFADGSLLLEQTKSALSTNPISDWSEDLWKAFANWIVQIEDGSFGSHSVEFRLYVTPSKVGNFATKLNDAQTADEVSAVIESIRSALKKRSTPPACYENVDALLNASEDTQRKLVSNFSLCAVDDDPIDPIRGLLNLTIDSASVDLIARSGIGQAGQALDREIRQRKAPILSVDNFRKAFHSFVRTSNLANYLSSFAPEPAEEDLIAVADSRPIFIRQLELINISSEEKQRAVSDFMRTSADRTDWAEAGYIMPDSLDTWDNDLEAYFHSTRGDVEDLHGARDAETKGRLIYRSCGRHNPPLDGRAVPPHFVNGSFNGMSEQKRIGWHPDFSNLLDDK